MVAYYRLMAVFSALTFPFWQEQLGWAFELFVQISQMLEALLKKLFCLGLRLKVHPEPTCDCLY
jgi:hypothetical protein